MKKIIIVLAFVMGISGANYFENHYTRKNCEVINTYEDCGVVIKDSCGYRWVVYDDSLEIGEIVDLKMHTNNTISYIEDDVVQKVIRKGF